MIEKPEDLAGVKIRYLRFGIILGELPNPAEIGFNRALAQTFKLDEGGVMLIPIGGGDVPVI